MKELVVIGLCVLYVLSPIDFLPEIVLGPFGLPDDIYAIFTAFKAMSGETGGTAKG